MYRAELRQHGAEVISYVNVRTVECIQGMNGNRGSYAEDFLSQRITDQPISLCAPFCVALLFTFDLSKFCNFCSHIVLKLPEHSWFVAKLEKDF